MAELEVVWHRAPLQALARLHVLAAADLAAPDQLGRPRPDPGIGPRLAALADVITAAPWPAPVMVAVVHGELLALQPFGSADGVVARAAARLAMMTSGLDPDGLACPGGRISAHRDPLSRGGAGFRWRRAGRRGGVAGAGLPGSGRRRQGGRLDRRRGALSPGGRSGTGGARAWQVRRQLPPWLNSIA